MKMVDKKIAIVNEMLQNVKDNSWVGHITDDTDEIDYIRAELKSLLDSGNIEVRERLEITKQLLMLEKNRIDKGKHLDMVMLKRAEISSESKGKEIVTELWSKK